MNNSQFNCYNTGRRPLIWFTFLLRNTVIGQEFQENGCYAGWSAIGHYCMAFVRKQITYYEASNLCDVQLQGQLASIVTPEELAYIDGKTVNSPSFINR